MFHYFIVKTQNTSDVFPQTASCYGVLTCVISVDHWAADSESVARWPRSVCWLGPVVPWSRLAPVWPRTSLLGRVGIGGPVAPFGVLAWSRGPVVPSGPSLSSSLFAVCGPRSGIIKDLSSKVNLGPCTDTWVLK